MYCESVHADSSSEKQSHFAKDNMGQRNNRLSRSTVERSQRGDAWKVDRISFTNVRDDGSGASDSSADAISKGRSSDHPADDDAPKQAWQVRLLKNSWQRRKSPEAAPMKRKRTLQANRLRQADVDYDESDDGDSSRDGDDGSDYSSGKDASNDLGTRRRRWTELEVRRVRAWKTEGKSESWIAARLTRTESAVKQQWRKMTE
jgi:hypothetical protein